MWALYSVSNVKILKFSKSKMAVAAILKIKKIAIFPQRFERSLRNLLRWCKIGLLTARTVKKLNFKHPRWRTAAILKTVISSYLCILLTHFDKIWHGDACWSLTPGVKFKFSIFDILIWQIAAIWRWKIANIPCNYTMTHYTILTIKQHILMLKTAVYPLC